MRVLIAEDEPEVRATLLAMLALEERLEVVAACSDGREALARAHTTAPHVVISDLNMPHLDGITLARQLRSLPKPPHVLLLTGQLAPGQAEQALAAGVATIMLKPPQLHKLLDAVHSLAATAEPQQP